MPAHFISRIYYYNSINALAFKNQMEDLIKSCNPMVDFGYLFTKPIIVLTKLTYQIKIMLSSD